MELAGLHLNTKQYTATLGAQKQQVCSGGAEPDPHAPERGAPSVALKSLKRHLLLFTVAGVLVKKTNGHLETKTDPSLCSGMASHVPGGVLPIYPHFHS